MWFPHQLSSGYFSSAFPGRVMTPDYAAITITDLIGLVDPHETGNRNQSFFATPFFCQRRLPPFSPVSLNTSILTRKRT